MTKYYRLPWNVILYFILFSAHNIWTSNFIVKYEWPNHEIFYNNITSDCRHQAGHWEGQYRLHYIVWCLLPSKEFLRFDDCKYTRELDIGRGGSKNWREILVSAEWGPASSFSVSVSTSTDAGARFLMLFSSRWMSSLCLFILSSKFSFSLFSL